jgi:hypothetical protein
VDRWVARGCGLRSASPAGRVARRAPAAAAGRRRATLGRDGAGPPAGALARSGRLPQPFGKPTVPLPTALAVVTATTAARLVTRCLADIDRPGYGPQRPGRSGLIGRPAGPGFPRSGLPEKLPAPEQNSGAESERREDAHGD